MSERYKGHTAGQNNQSGLYDTRSNEFIWDPNPRYEANLAAKKASKMEQKRVLQDGYKSGEVIQPIAEKPYAFGSLLVVRDEFRDIRYAGYEYFPSENEEVYIESPHSD